MPVAEWGREEFALAQELALPIGRATPDGMDRLAELLGLDGSEDGKLVDPRGDGLARSLPQMLRVHPDRFFYSVPPSDVELPQLMRELRNFLDAPGFEWLCALAVYPAVQWDLTLYLGVTLPELRGRMPEEQPLYREDRIAALTHLPWLREGIMPVWLRRALIVELGKAGRADEVREALKALIEEAKRLGERRSEDDVVFRIAREQPKEGFDPERLYDDEVLLDFMARGRVEDFALPRRTWLEALLPRGLLDRIGVPGLVAGAVVLVYAAAAWWVTPKLDGVPWGLWSDTRGALTLGAWLPLTVLCLGGLVALVLANPPGALLARTVLVRGAAPFFALAMVMVVLAIAPRTALPCSGVAEAAVFALSLGCLLLARRLATWLWIIEPPSSARRFTAWGAGKVILTAIGLAIAAWIAFGIIGTFPAMVTGRVSLQRWWFSTFTSVTILLLLFALGWRLSQRSSAATSMVRTPLRPHRTRFSAVARVAAALLLIAPAVVLARHVSTISRVLEPAAPGSAVVAETPDGRFLAIGGADGRVQVYDTRGETPQQTRAVVDTGLGAIASLAIAARNPAYPDGALVVAAGGANGRVAVRELPEAAAIARPSWAEQPEVRSVGQAPQVALGRDGRLLVAIEVAGMPARLLSGPGHGQQLVLDGRGSVTALAALDGERFAVATMDGAIGLVAVSVTGALTLLPDGETPPRFSESRVRRLAFDAAGNRLTAVGDDGTILTASLAQGALRLDGPARREQSAALGAAVPWNRERLVCTEGAMISVGLARVQRCVRPGEAFRDCPTCPEMVVVPAGRFTRGSPATEQDRFDDEGPQREVTIRQPIGVGKFEVTFDEWEACATAGGCKHRPGDRGWGRGRRPVIEVSWEDAKEYVAWLSRETGATYRLLTEAEWEYAARAGTTTPFSTGPAITTDQANFDGIGTYGGSARGQYRGRTIEVGAFQPNAFGLHDMHGNVWEWVEDCYVDNYRDAPRDGSARPATGKCVSRVLRGGSWFDSPRLLRSAQRYLAHPGGRVDLLGFRLARTLPPSP